ncbi:MAG: hypothetical protein ACE361_26230 [Aureliella sp.]
MKKPNETELLSQLAAGIPLGPVSLRSVRKSTRVSQELGVDAIAELESDLGRIEFLVEAKARSTPSMFQGALDQVRRIAGEGNRLPLVLLPYLSEQQLNQLEEVGVSGVDLCGNGVVTVPGTLLVYRTGNKNKFPDSAPTKYAYRGKTSLVARVFLLKSCFSSYAEIEETISARAGSVAVSTISKAIKRLEEDLIVERGEELIRLRQADKLLDQLAKSFVEPKVTRSMRFSLSCSLAEFFADDFFRDEKNSSKVVLSGASSVSRYAVMGSNEWPVLYCRNVDRLLSTSAQSKMEQAERFVDLEIQETADATVYFDVRRDGDGVPFASPIQSYLELQAGDKRQKEAAKQIRDVILNAAEALEET